MPVGAAQHCDIAPGATALRLFFDNCFDEPLVHRLVSRSAGDRDNRHLGDAAVGVLRLFRRRLHVDFVGSGEEVGDQMVEKFDKKRCRTVVVRKSLGSNLSAREGWGERGPEHIGRRPPPLIDRLFPVSHEEDRPVSLGIAPHGAEDIFDQRPKQGKLDLRRVLKLVEEQMGRSVEAHFIEACSKKRSVGAVRSIKGDELPWDVVEEEPSEFFLLLGNDVGTQGDETLEKGASQPFRVDEVFGDQNAHSRIEVLQGRVGGRGAIGCSYANISEVVFEEKRPFEVHPGERFKQGGGHLAAQGSPRRFRDDLHLGTQLIVLGDKPRLFALECIEQTLGAVPCLQ